MTLPIALVLALVGAAALLLITERLRPDLLALLLLVVLGLTGLVAPADLFAGFSRNAVITILALFIITDGLERTGATRWLGQRLQQAAAGGETRTVLVVTVATAVLSLVMNNIAAAAVVLPVTIGLARQRQLPPSKLLIPLSFGSLLGGMATLFTTANILVSNTLAENHYQPYGVLDFALVGLPMALAGIGFLAVFGQRLLPVRVREGRESLRPGNSLAEAYQMRELVRAVYVKPGAALAGLSLAAGGWGGKLGLNVLGLSRGGAINLAPARSEVVREGDVVLFTGHIDPQELEAYGLIFTEDPGWTGQLASDEISLVEVTLAPRSSLAGKTLREIQFRDRYNLSVLAIWREGNTLRDALAEIPLRFGDALLMQGQRSRIQQLRKNPNFLVLEEDVGEAGALPRRAWVALGLTAAAVILPAANLLPIAQAAFAAACLMVLFNCLSMDEAYESIEWKSVFLIAGMLPLGTAIAGTGAAALIGQWLVSGLGGWGPLAVAGGLFLLATLLTQVLSGQVTPVVLAPIAIAAAEHLQADPRGMAMAVALGCSMAFLTPISHSANMLVMGPGGYKFGDYARVGLPLSLVLLVVFLIGLAVFWGIH
ncbi:MAG: SLC13 family permease [Anaerolineales bacterium]|nr:SLC13 family permease [Anaerolineales bacterium]